MLKRQMAIVLTVGGLVLLLTLFASVCVTAEPGPDLNADLTEIVSRPLVYPLDAEPDLDVSRLSDSASVLVVGQLMEGLYAYRGDGTLEPAGALTHTASADARVFTFTLRSDAVWSDGEPVTAQHYVDGILRLLDPATGSGAAWVMYDIEGAAGYNAGDITDPDEVGVHALDATTLEFTLNGPGGHFPSIAAMYTAYPVRLEIIDSDPDWTEPGHFLGNGPYLLTEWVHGSHLALARNPLYHDADQVKIDEVVLPIIADTADQLAAYEDDTLDASGFPGEEVSRILADPILSSELHRKPRPGVYYVGLNTQLAPTDNATVRKALASAIDRDLIVAEILSSPWRIGLTGAIPAGIPGYQGEEVGYPFNVTQAQAYLAAAGYPDGDGFPELELWYHAGSEPVMESVAEQWRTNLGISVTTVVTDWTSYLQDLDDCRWDSGGCSYHAYRNGWVLDWADAGNILDIVFHPDSWFQYTGWDNARYRELMDLARAEPQFNLRTGYFEEADEILAEEEAAIIPIYSYDLPILVKSDISFEYAPITGARFAKWEITEQVTATIPPAGGLLSSPDGDIELEFPPGAVTGSIVATYTAQYIPSVAAPAGFGFSGNAFTLEAVYQDSGEPVTTFVNPFVITIQYTDGDLGVQDDATLELRYLDGSTWSTDGITILERDLENNRFVASAGHLTEFALIGESYAIYLPVILRSP